MRVQVIDVGEPSPEKFAALLGSLYKEELVERTIEAANYSWSGDLAFATAGITEVNVWEQAAAEMPTAIRANAQEHVSRIAAADFFEGAALPVIPQTKGREWVFSLMREKLVDASRLVANQMQMRQDVSFVLREPDYQIELVIPAFQTVPIQKTEVKQTVQNCSYARITLKEGPEKILYSEKHAANVTNFFPLGTKRMSTWLSYQDAMSKLFYEGIKKIRQNPKAQRLFKDCVL
jgi:hypothetical protein